MSIDFDLQSLKRLHRDSEKQLLEFNDIIPYEHNPNNLYSPILVNLLLQVGPQVENVTDLLVRDLDLKPDGNGVPSRIREINKSGVLSGFRTYFLAHDTQFTPFTQELEWWDIYNKTKHDLAKSQFEITYGSVMNSMAALASLHRLADAATHCNKEVKMHVSNKEYWNEPTFVVNREWIRQDLQNRSYGYSWRSLAFKITTYFIYASDA